MSYVARMYWSEELKHVRWKRKTLRDTVAENPSRWTAYRLPLFLIARHVVLVRVRAPRPLYHVRSLFGHHDDRCYGIAVGSRGEHGRVHHPQVGHAQHPELRVDHRARVAGRSHLARARMMVLRFGVRDHHARPVRVAVVRMVLAARQRRRVRPHVPFGQRLCAHQRQHDPNALYHGLHVPRVLEIVRLDDGAVQRVAGPERDVAHALGQKVRGPGPHVSGRRGRTVVVLPVRRAFRVQGDFLTVRRQPVKVHLSVGYLEKRNRCKLLTVLVIGVDNRKIIKTL